MRGRILKAISGFYYLEYEDNIFECRARGIFRKNKEIPLVGDYVEFDTEGLTKGNIRKIMTRKNELIRPPISNIDEVVIVSSIEAPKPSLIFIDKQIAFLERAEIDVVICLNKQDLGDSLEIAKIYKDIGYKVITTSVKDNIGIEELKYELKGKVGIFVGNSGVGKSSLTNKILGRNVMEEGQVSKIERGRQTTRHTELIKIDSQTYIADSPGFSSFELNLEEDIADYFIEFRKYKKDCEYRDCTHILEEKCGIKEALEKGHISYSRYNSYKELKSYR